MNKIRYTEMFLSIQGEGLRVGVPSIFFRTYGCNLRCKNFGMDPNLKIDGPNPEVAEIIKSLDIYNDYEDLPLVSTGCDSYSSTYSEFKRFAKTEAIDDIAVRINELLPVNKWEGVDLVITGGEPLLGWQKAFPELLSHRLIQPQNITFETNGTQEITSDLTQHIDRNYHDTNFIFSVSPKLSISGEKWEDAIKPDVINEYQDYGYVYLKFVVSKDTDINEVKQAIQEYKDGGFYGDIYLMPVGGEQNLYNLNNKAVAEIAMQNGWRYSPRLQVDLFKNQWGT